MNASKINKCFFGIITADANVKYLLSLLSHDLWGHSEGQREVATNCPSMLRQRHLAADFRSNEGMTHSLTTWYVALR